jgi:hypothetical protein
MLEADAEGVHKIENKLNISCSKVDLPRNPKAAIVVTVRGTEERKAGEETNENN